MKKSLSVAVGILASSAMLAACGGSGSYCDDLEEAQAEFEAFGVGDIDQFEEVIQTFRDLADSAPGEVSDDWAVLVEGLDTFEQALADAGIDFSDLAALQSGQLPEGVEMEDLEAIGEATASIDQSGFDEASENIEEHANDECGVDFS